MPASVTELRKEPAVDRGLLEACRQGDREALRVLFDATKDRVYSIAFWYCGDAASAKDVSQEVFLKLCARIGQFRGDADFGTWLYRLVVNTCIDERRRRRRMVPLMKAEARRQITGLGPQEHLFARHQRSEAVHVALAQLSPKLRLPIVLRYLEELSYEEIAAVLGCGKGTVASRLSRGHRELARRLAALREALE